MIAKCVALLDAGARLAGADHAGRRSVGLRGLALLSELFLRPRCLSRLASAHMTHYPPVEPLGEQSAPRSQFRVIATGTPMQRERGERG